MGGWKLSRRLLLLLGVGRDMVSLFVRLFVCLFVVVFAGRGVKRGVGYAASDL